MKENTIQPKNEQQISDANRKIKELIDEFLELSIGVCEFSKVESMETLLKIVTADDMRQLGLEETMQEYLDADDREED